MSVAISIIIILISVFVLAGKKKNSRILFVSLFTLLLVFLSINILRFINPTFRFNYDIRFNNSDEQVVYENDNEHHLKLPKGTIIAYKYSDYGVMCFTKLTYDEFVEYYKNNGYIVRGNEIILEDATYTLKEEGYYENVYTKIRIEASIH